MSPVYLSNSSLGSRAQGGRQDGFMRVCEKLGEGTLLAGTGFSSRELLCIFLNFYVSCIIAMIRMSGLKLFMKFNIIGAGRLGKNIALALSAAQIASMQAVCNLKPDSAQQSCQDIGLGYAVNQLAELPEADITWITSNDDAIKPIAASLAELSLLKPRSIVVHCSGVLNSALLEPLKAQGCFIATFHPLKAFRTGYLSADAFKNVDCVLEGDEEACAWLHHSFTQLGAHVFTINSESKAAYHAAACIASNYLITLASCSEQLLLTAGIPQERAKSLICKLMQGNVNNLQETPLIAESLTGPLMRGDNETLVRHLQAIENPLIEKLYKAAGLATLPLTQLSEDKKQMITELLEDGLAIPALKTQCQQGE